VTIAVGDRVRVHYHPPGQRESFIEGVVSRVDVTTIQGRVFVVDVAADVILGRKQPARPGYQNYILHDHPDDFPGRIEVLSQAEQEPASEAMPEPVLEAESAHQPEPQPSAEHEIEPEPAPASESERAEDQGSRVLGNVVNVLFGRRT
jgi:hypothetical protein